MFFQSLYAPILFSGLEEEQMPWGGAKGGLGDGKCLPPAIVATVTVLAVVDGGIAIVAFLQVDPLSVILLS